MGQGGGQPVACREGIAHLILVLADQDLIPSYEVDDGRHCRRNLSPPARTAVNPPTRGRPAVAAPGYRLGVAAAYTVTCQGELSGGTIVKLKEMGLYRVRVAPGRFDEGETRHELRVEAGSAEDAILRAKGAVAVAGGSARNYKASEEGEPSEPAAEEGA